MQDVHDPTETTMPTSDEKLLFSKHVGRTFKEVYEQDSEFCQWVMMTVQMDQEVTPEMTRFATWVSEMEVQIAETGMMELDAEIDIL